MRHVAAMSLFSPLQPVPIEPDRLENINSQRLLSALSNSHLENYKASHKTFFSRSDVLIQMKHIFRVVASFDLYQTIIVGSVSRGDPVALLIRHKIYISAG
jgi:hypothetical protein